MADPVEVLLNIGGWIVAGAATALGVVLAHRLQQRGDERREDRVLLHEPLRKEVDQIVANEDQIATGADLWAPSTGFKDILQRGALRAHRHLSLARDIDRLGQLHEAHEADKEAFYTARWDASKAELPGAKFTEVGGKEVAFFNAISVSPQDPLFLGPLASGSRESWKDNLGHAMRNMMAANIDHRTLRPPSDELFDAMDRRVADARASYRESARALVAQARAIRDGLDRALQHGRQYT